LEILQDLKSHTADQESQRLQNIVVEYDRDRCFTDCIGTTKTNNPCNGRDILNISPAWHREETVQCVHPPAFKLERELYRPTILCVFKLFYVEGVCSKNVGKQNTETSPLTRLVSDVTIYYKKQ